MKYSAIIIVLTFLLNCGCTRHATAPQSSNAAIKLTRCFPSITSKGDIYMREDSMHLYKLNGMLVYRATAATKVDWDDMTKQQVDYFCYFVCAGGDAMGYKYDSLTAITPVYISADSFLKRHAPQPQKPFSLGKIEKLVERKKKADGTIVEKYIYLVKPDKSYSDTAIYYYAKTGTYFHSLNREHDSMRQMQLYRYSFYYKKEPPLPERTFYWQLSHATIDNEPLLLNLIERHRKWLQPAKQQ